MGEIIARNMLSWLKLSIKLLIISAINQIDAQNVCFTISLFDASTCFEHMVLETCRGMKWTYCKTKFLFIKLVDYWDKYAEMHGQQNVKKLLLLYLFGCLSYVLDISPAGTELLLADRQTSGTELIVACRKSAIAPKYRVYWNTCQRKIRLWCCVFLKVPNCCMRQSNLQGRDKWVPVRDLAGCNKVLLLHQSVRFARMYFRLLASTAVSTQHTSTTVQSIVIVIWKAHVVFVSWDMDSSAWYEYQKAVSFTHVVQDFLLLGFITSSGCWMGGSIPLPFHSQRAHDCFPGIFFFKFMGYNGWDGIFMGVAVWRSITPHRVVELYRRFGRTSCPYFHGWWKNNIAEDNSEHVSDFGKGSDEWRNRWWWSLWPEGLIPDMGSSTSGFGIQPDSWSVNIECFLPCGNCSYLSVRRDAGNHGILLANAACWLTGCTTPKNSVFRMLHTDRCDIKVTCLDHLCILVLGMP